jgi:glutamate dehydrogenase (NAD(P)+)
VELGGSRGRASATGRGVVICTKLLLAERGRTLDGLRVAIQGNGNVGGNAAKIFHHRNVRVVAMSDVSGGIYCEAGLDADAIGDYASRGGLLRDYDAGGVRHITNDEVLTCECDVLVPAALENQLDEEVAERLRCEYIVEAANGPTTVEADEVLERRGILVAPDIFANSGGVIVSYFEWVQNIQELTWARERVHEMLEDIMTKAYAEIKLVQGECGCTLRMAAYVLALRRLIYAEEIKGIFP